MLKKIVLSILGEGESQLALRKKTFDKVRMIVYTDCSEELLPNELNSYIEKVSRNAYKIIDKDIELLKTSGFTEDEIFELTIVAAFSAGESRVELATNLLNSSFNDK